MISQNTSSMSPPLQPHSLTNSSAPALIGRGSGYTTNPYPMSRSPYSTPHSSLNEIPRYTQFPTHSRSSETTSNSSPSTIYSHSNNMMLDPSPRSNHNAIDAPPFHDTVVSCQIIANNQSVKPEIISKIHKGFFQVDDKWTCYRRNYFSVTCGFTFRPYTQAGTYFVRLPARSNLEPVRSFSMAISAIVNGHEGENRELVQHTPKRDKQSETKPGKIPMQPQAPPSLSLNPGSAAGTQLGFGGLPHTSAMQIDYGSSYPASQATQPATSHTFERIQFQKATANNGKRRAQQQYYNLVVELFAEVASPHDEHETQWVSVAKRLSHPMVVRGRSPGHYKDGRRDSTSSMGPDGGVGPGGDGGGGSVLSSMIGGPRNHLSLSYSHHGGSSHLSREYRHMYLSDPSPLIGNPFNTSASTEKSRDLDFGMQSSSTHNVLGNMPLHSNEQRFPEPTYLLGPTPKTEPDMHEFKPSMPFSSVSGSGFDSMLSVVRDDHRNGTLSQTPLSGPPSSMQSYEKRSDIDHGIGNVFSRFDTNHYLPKVCT